MPNLMVDVLYTPVVKAIILFPTDSERVDRDRFAAREEIPMLHISWRIITVTFFVAFLLFLGNLSVASDTTDYFKISVIDDATGRGVPLVELKTTSDVRYYTDSNGIIAFYEPGLMNKEVYFHVRSHGYEFPTDGLGNRGKTLKPTRGGSALLRIKRINIAERLYRITGEGIYRDSFLVGQTVPTAQSLLNGQVTGQDSVLVTPYKGRLYWFWGDTSRVSYALGNFGSSGATSELPGNGGLDPSVGVDLTYFVDGSGFSKPMCPLPGGGLVWMFWLVTVPDDSGTDRLVAGYSRIKDLGEAYERVIGVFNDKTETFEPLARPETSLKEPTLAAHPFRGSAAGEDYFFFAGRRLFTRIKADLKHLTDPKTYESFTPLTLGSNFDKGVSQLDRSSDGRLRYSWKADTDFVNYERQQELIAAGKMKPDEALWQLLDSDTGEAITASPGSVFWNNFRKRWVMFLERSGQVWYAEGDTFLGPWVYAKKIVTHDRYSFYNVTQHPYFDQDRGRLVYFEGTYTDAFASPPDITPRYNYNQIMYRLALDDPRLFLPAPVYLVRPGNGAASLQLRETVESNQIWSKVEAVPFFAVPPDRKREGLIPIFGRTEKGSTVLGTAPPAGASEQNPPLFYALPVVSRSPEVRLTGAWRCKSKDSSGSEFVFFLDLKVEGEQVKGRSADDELVITSGSFKGERIELNLKDNEGSYILTARLRDGKLSGEFKKIGTSESGTWEGERSDLPSPIPSAGVVLLYEYVDSLNGSLFYSTNPDLANRTTKRTAEPICRVWRNPMSTLILDPQTVPVSFTRKNTTP